AWAFVAGAPATATPRARVNGKGNRSRTALRTRMLIGDRTGRCVRLPATDGGRGGGHRGRRDNWRQMSLSCCKEDHNRCGGRVPWVTHLGERSQLQVGADYAECAEWLRPRNKLVAQRASLLVLNSSRHEVARIADASRAERVFKKRRPGALGMEASSGQEPFRGLRVFRAHLL